MQENIMFRAIGFVIGLFAITQLMSQTFQAFEDAATETLQTIEVAAELSQRHMLEFTQ